MGTESSTADFSEGDTDAPFYSEQEDTGLPNLENDETPAVVVTKEIKLVCVYW